MRVHNPDGQYFDEAERIGALLVKGKLHGKSVEEMMKFGFQRGLMKNPIV